MGRKGSWFSALKRALSSESKKKDKAAHKSKWFGKEKTADLGCSRAESVAAMPPNQQEKLMEAESEQNKHAYSVAIATAVAAEAAVAAAQAAAEVVRLTAAAHSSGKSKEEIAAIRIQTAFRGYLARRALRALKGLVRLKTMLHGQSVKRQATSTLKCMQTLARVQSEVRARRLRMVEENQALQKQKQEKEVEKLGVSEYGENWDVSTQSKEQIEANLQSKHDAAKRRERALAYAYTHQTLRNSSKPSHQTFMNPNNPHWGWSWLERWMAARPWESKTAIDREETNATSSRHDFQIDSRPSPSPSPHKHTRRPSFQSPSTPTSKPRRLRPQSPRGSCYGEDDSRSLTSAQSERCRRHSIAGSSVRDDESLASSPAIPSYMTPTESAKARSRMPSPLSAEKNYATPTPEKAAAAVGSAKKRLSFSGSPGGPRRHSGPPKIDISFSKYLNVHS
ncbi:PREDICTED: protein IQ-DOMAIN 1-like [Ipomoea nil]|uniref:protein IQ-DOMAIN 1-like n=1 Tax=Ipomoea nil TaxID=35883 RepID=UPI000900DA17|nr:PREDICTED: protein IQ-DOMAIN 1-like [Ipomoea nil]XP_019198513.1 PREDICTED: protein IQ-DOMAIN 1-like [Ipomoea nil]XP_019198514.1 PREDICTED: protein IQ-DOMAIN 1-like [Ipomoea nil]